jgi:hypothetical protein
VESGRGQAGDRDSRQGAGVSTRRLLGWTYLQAVRLRTGATKRFRKMENVTAANRKFTWISDSSQLQFKAVAADSVYTLLG